jgi:valyl-tRNA synthetase
VLINAGELPSRPEIPSNAPLALVHRWILQRLNVVTRDVQEALETFRFDVAADRLYHFFWDEYADWYIEMVKPHLQAGGEEAATAQAVLLEVHDRTLRLLHPIIPFVTEDLWQRLPRRAGDAQALTLAAWPRFRDDWVEGEAEREVALLQGGVITIRTARAERRVKPSARVSAVLEGASPEHQRVLRSQETYLRTLAGLASFEFGDGAPGGEDVVTRVLGDLRVHIQLPHTDRGAEIEKLRRQLADKVREVANVDGKLASQAFVSKAPAHVVEGARAQREKLLVEQRRLEETLRDLGES